MVKKEVLFIVIISLFLASSFAVASTLNLGPTTYNFKLTNFHSNSDEYRLLDLGYGIDQERGLGLEVMSGSQKSVIGVEYQFIPSELKNKQQVDNLALKLGAVSGTLFSDRQGLKAGFVVNKKLENKEVYFDTDLIQGQEFVINAELGISGEISPGILGVIGYKMVSSQTDRISGSHYGIKIDF